MPNIFDDTENMEDIGAIYTRLEGNCPTPSSTSKKLWILRQKNDISPCNKSSEKILEKAVALLAYNGYMPGWFNQCPAASGITDSANNKHSNVDLVHWSALDKRARLVELKIGSNDPLYALREILRYGAAYVFCRIHKDKLLLQDRPLMEARHVSLEVAAPAFYFQDHHDLAGALARMRKFLDEFDAGSRINGLTMSLDALAFSGDFKEIPFENGEEVRQKCDIQRLTAEGRIVRDAFNSLTSVV